MVDPQMIIIVLLGDLSIKPDKGKSKQGDTPIVNVRLGRYACIIEFLEVLDSTAESSKSKGNKPLQKFVETIDSRLGSMLLAEEKTRRYPDLYRALLCCLLWRLRAISMAPRKAPWMPLLLTWISDDSSDTQESKSLVIGDLNTAYNDLATTDPALENDQPFRSSGMRQGTQLLPAASTEKAILKVSLQHAALKLLALVHACLSTSDWATLLPVFWGRYAQWPKEIGPVCRHSIRSRRMLTESGDFSAHEVWRADTSNGQANHLG